MKVSLPPLLIPDGQHPETEAREPAAVVPLRPDGPEAEQTTHDGWDDADAPAVWVWR